MTIYRTSAGSISLAAESPDVLADEASRYDRRQLGSSSAPSDGRLTRPGG